MPKVGYKVQEIKNSKFYKSLESDLASKSLAIDGVASTGYATIGGSPTKQTEVYISDGQVLTLFVSKDGKLHHLELDGLTLKDREEKTTESKLAKDVSKYVAKKSKIKLKREIDKKIKLPEDEKEDLSSLISERDELKKEIDELEKRVKELR